MTSWAAFSSGSHLRHFSKEQKIQQKANNTIKSLRKTVMKKLLNFKGCKKYMIIIITLHYNFTGPLSIWGPHAAWLRARESYPPPPSPLFPLKRQRSSVREITSHFKEIQGTFKTKSKKFDVPSIVITSKFTQLCNVCLIFIQIAGYDQSCSSTFSFARKGN